jgi:hypothetical protein
MDVETVQEVVCYTVEYSMKNPVRVRFDLEAQALEYYLQLRKSLKKPKLYCDTVTSTRVMIKGVQ